MVAEPDPPNKTKAAALAFALVDGDLCRPSPNEGCTDFQLPTTTTTTTTLALDLELTISIDERQADEVVEEYQLPKLDFSGTKILNECSF